MDQRRKSKEKLKNMNNMKRKLRKNEEWFGEEWFRKTYINRRKFGCCILMIVLTRKFWYENPD